MNFLSHHFFYSTQDAWHNTGLILPDWSRAATGRRKLDWKAADHGGEKSEALWEGCRKHYEADIWFHECAYFTETTRHIEGDLAHLQEDGLFLLHRKWFLAHLLAEMLLDRLIIDRYPEALDHFYHDLRKVPYQDLEQFLLEAGKDEMGLFPRAHKGFIESEFIRHYKSHEGLGESLNRVVQRTGQQAFSVEESEAIVRFMDSWLTLAGKTKKPLHLKRL